MAHGGNVIAEFTADHRELEELFARIEAQPVDHPQRRVLANRLTAELVRHSVAEEMHLCPTVRKHVRDGEELAEKELAEHVKIERLLRDLEELHVDDPQFNDIVAKLRLEVASHVREEEQELFPKLAASCSPEKLDELGRLARHTKQTARTCPHFTVPDTPPAHELLVPGAGLVDRVRDLVHGRRTKG
ncbi:MULTISPECIES: hemerythrin domain-containing protein [unclassified Streptomyces]|uniref:hemerythrin domain-containing protein n=1 Tax=unclassified Streptomyces TaxID=2593676 RepID=UPI00224EC1C8|nr:MULTISPECIES: hemerythrin domain-containing protein [unclassified Streptomyces]WSP54776.1 hemerythrin domain-containing protein [Streptomyces sp. NBC_01241]WSU24546.1 hemerythrin domain-containing protein [Streptomyces sp. NBC_01108]MCX4786339.1 hemerythrin domain-containing protein [Streptomyces sp. NBC_01221]MCX4797805.1 hemerythrin domain-containing protein [Streptomyces sp. NBC_01242]WSJ39082.1 hemerythrin domain-containing protein [Streptomyces sp. NBC_01321]